MSTQSILDTLGFVKQFKGQTILVKLGGSILDEPQRMAMLCEDMTLLRAAGIKVVIVHGGSKAIESLLRQHQLSWTFVRGQRVTTPAMMAVIEMALSGKVNPALVRALNQLGVDAVGLSGTDQQLLLASPVSDEFGEVGVVKQVNVAPIEPYLQQQTLAYSGVIPVISPVATSQTGRALNVNADWAASCIAQALQVNKLIYLTDQDGILDADGACLSTVNISALLALIKSAQVQGGMLTKCETIIHALRSGVECVHILNAKKPHVLIDELFTPHGVGTLCTAREAVCPV